MFTAVFSPDGRTLATLGFDGELRTWDRASARQLRHWSRNPAQPQPVLALGGITLRLRLLISLQTHSIVGHYCKLQCACTLHRARECENLFIVVVWRGMAGKHNYYSLFTFMHE